MTAAFPWPSRRRPLTAARAGHGRVTLRRILGSILLLLLVAGGVLAWQIGPRNILGMLLYDQRRDGDLSAGDHAPDVTLVKLDGTGTTCLSELVGGQPLVLIFGSFT